MQFPADAFSLLFLTPDTMVAASYLSFGTVPEWKGVEIKYTRRAK